LTTVRLQVHCDRTKNVAIATIMLVVRMRQPKMDIAIAILCADMPQ